MGLYALLLDATPVGFSSAQIESITTALGTAITNTLNMFVALMPIFATICGVAFGIKFVTKRFQSVGGTGIRAK